MTLETRDAVRNARIVFDMSDRPSFIRSLNRRSVCLDDVYWSSRPYGDVYRQIVEMVLAEIRKGPGVALIGYGHPLVFDDINLELLAVAKRQGFRVQVLAAVSCIDTICVDLGIDLGNGIQIVEAGGLVHNRIAMNAKLEALVLQVGNFNTATTDEVFKFKPGHFEPLVRHLAKYYGLEHMATLVYSDDGTGRRVFRTRLKNLDRWRERIFPGITLFVPARRR
jgi:uncharacterized protein YabN with tetrapyrrole methylase and pyrophosphatase domain